MCLVNMQYTFCGVLTERYYVYFIFSRGLFMFRS